MRRRHVVLTSAILFTLLLILACGEAGTADKPAYTAQDFSKLKGMTGFSDKLLDLHFTLYQGYVKNTNALLAQLGQMARENQANAPAYAELKRRLGWEFDGMRLHELYFGNLGGKGARKPDSPLMARLAEQFGSYDAWLADFQATGAMRGIGWVVLYEDPKGGRLMNMWVNEHDGGHPAGCTPLLVMDMFEHAYLTDYGLKKADYIQAFFNNIDWAAVEARIKK